MSYKTNYASNPSSLLETRLQGHLLIVNVDLLSDLTKLLLIAYYLTRITYTGNNIVRIFIEKQTLFSLPIPS